MDRIARIACISAGLVSLALLPTCWVSKSDYQFTGIDAVRGSPWFVGIPLTLLAAVLIAAVGPRRHRPWTRLLPPTLLALSGVQVLIVLLGLDDTTTFGFGLGVTAWGAMLVPMLGALLALRSGVLAADEATSGLLVHDELDPGCLILAPAG